MDLRTVLELAIAAVALGMGLTLAGTSLVAASCLIQYAVLIVLDHESVRFRAFSEEHASAVSGYKLLLLVVAFAALFVLP